MSNCNDNCGLPRVFPLDCLRGDDKECVLYFRQEDPDGTLAPMDLTFFSDWHACVYAKHPSVEICEIETLVLNPTQGKVVLKIPHDSLLFTDWPAATYMWQLRATNERGLRETIVSNSTLEVRPNE